MICSRRLRVPAVQGSTRLPEPDRRRPLTSCGCTRPAAGSALHEELGPEPARAAPDRALIAAIFEKHDMSLLGPPPNSTLSLRAHMSLPRAYSSKGVPPGTAGHASGLTTTEQHGP